MLGSHGENQTTTIHDLPDELLRAIFLATAPRTFYASVQRINRRCRSIARTILDPEGRVPILVTLKSQRATSFKKNALEKRVELQDTFTRVGRRAHNPTHSVWAVAEVTFHLTQITEFFNGGVQLVNENVTTAHQCDLADTQLGQFIYSEIERDCTLHRSQRTDIQQPKIRVVIECIQDTIGLWTQQEKFGLFAQYIQNIARPTKLNMSWKFFGALKTLQIGAMDSVLSVTLRDSEDRSDVVHLSSAVLNELDVAFPKLQSVELWAAASSNLIVRLSDFMSYTFLDRVTSFQIVSVLESTAVPLQHYKTSERVVFHLPSTFYNLKSLGTLTILPWTLHHLSEGPVLPQISSLSVGFSDNHWDFRSSTMAITLKRISSAITRSFPNLRELCVDFRMGCVHTTSFRKGWASIIQTVPAMRFVFKFPIHSSYLYGMSVYKQTLKELCRESRKEAVFVDSIC
ncbi:hypothetical protein HDU93_009054 [Gonapodya sp. JEL0774]|nr:hypothetical protein HDU93_009054 [Gonapodya sp. JEL0774]